MGRRKRRHSHSRVWAPVMMMGLAALMSLLKEGRAPSGGARPQTNSDVKPLLTVMMLVGAFVALGVLLTALSAIASLGGGGVVIMICGFPVAIVSLIAWLVNNNRSGAQKAKQETDRWTIDGTATEVKQTEADARRTAAGPQPATRGWVPQFGQAPKAVPSEAQTTAAQTIPAPKGASKPAAKPVPERPAVTPSEYRQRAASYRRKIQSLIKTRRPGPIAERMTGVLQKLKSWEERVGQLADRLTLYEKDDLIQRDIRETPAHIERLQRQLALEAEPEMQRQIRRTLGAYQEQRRQLELLGKMMKRTRLNLDDTLAAMGTVYSQLQVLNAMDIDGPTAARIAGEVDREVERLNDLLAAVSDVYASSSEVAPLGEAPRTAAEADADTGLPDRKARLGGSAAN